MGKIILICAICYVAFILYKRRGNFAYNKGIKLIVAKNYADGLSLMEKSVELGVTPKQEITAAFAEVKFGDAVKAEQKINMVILNPKVKPLMKNEAKCVLAVIKIARGDINSALEIMDKLYPEFKTTKFYSTYGYLAIASGDMEFAKKINEEAYEYNNSNAVICDNYGLYLYNAGEFEKSEEIYEKIMEKEVKFPEAYYNYGRVLAKLGKIDKAKEMLEKALSMEYFGVTTIKESEVSDFYKTLD